MIFYIVLQRFTTFLPLFCPFYKQKNRKPEPAVKEHFRKFPFYLFLRLFSSN
nr:MAG TPA: hypothetical protein [Caudoviricetes sp.]